MIVNPQIRQFRTPEDFEAYLINLPAPSWFKKVAVHHTLIPTEVQWRGLSTMEGMLNHYKRLHWGGYPHIFATPDGIWQMNNVLTKGVHTNAANSFAIAVEVVGDYDKKLWQEPIRTYSFEAINSLQKWGKLAPSDIVLHRTYNTLKSCPGNSITAPWIISNLEKLRARQNTKEIKYRVKFNNSRIRQGPSTDYPIAGMLQSGDIFISTALKEDEGAEFIDGINTWAHVTKSVNTKSQVDHLGFVHRSLLEIIE